MLIMLQTPSQDVPGWDFGLFELCADILVEQEAKFCGVIVFWVQIHSNETML